MTKKLEELFNLEKSEETSETLKDKLETEQNDKDDAQANALIQEKIGLDKIDAALPQVDGLEDDKEIDQYSNESFQAYKDLMDLGMNIEPRFAGRIMEVASSMMNNAINAKNVKVDKKLKMIELQLKKLKLDQNQGDDDAVTGTGTVIADRNELIKQILASKDKDK
jgi:hypothetical protein|tara:strand:+ start:364 stop:861 length:498 start_codon:yes stop_codon:yes gene_type:complete